MENINFIPFKHDFSHFISEVRELRTTINELAVKIYRGLEDWKRFSTKEEIFKVLEDWKKPSTKEKKKRELKIETMENKINTLIKDLNEKITFERERKIDVENQEIQRFSEWITKIDLLNIRRQEAKTKQRDKNDEKEVYKYLKTLYHLSREVKELYFAISIKRKRRISRDHKNDLESNT